MRPSAPDILRTYAPDFCWMTRHDLLLLAEQVNEEVNDATVAAAISRLVKKGVLITKPDDTILPKRGSRGGRPRLYRRINHQ